MLKFAVRLFRTKTCPPVPEFLPKAGLKYEVPILNLRRLILPGLVQNLIVPRTTLPSEVFESDYCHVGLLPQDLANTDPEATELTGVLAGLSVLSATDDQTRIKITPKARCLFANPSSSWTTVSIPRAKDIPHTTAQREFFQAIAQLRKVDEAFNSKWTEASEQYELDSDISLAIDLAMTFLPHACGPHELQTLILSEPLVATRCKSATEFLIRESEITARLKIRKQDSDAEFHRQRKRQSLEAESERIRREIEALAVDGSLNPNPSSLPASIQILIDKAGSTDPHYIRALLSIPWVKPPTQKLPRLTEIREILNSSHHGLRSAKQLVLEALASPTPRPILLVGPPGCGKSSFARAVAVACQKKFRVISLAGVADSSELRGHRRAYVGAGMGSVSQALASAGTDCILILDEVDKVGASEGTNTAAVNASSLASSLLELLDDRRVFRDAYLDAELDISDILFIATANSIESIHPALLSRFQAVYIPGYLPMEKLEISRRHLIPCAFRGVTSHSDVLLPDETVLALINGWTKEAGVRHLNGLLERLARQKILESQLGESPRSEEAIGVAELSKRLGYPPFHQNNLEISPRPGQAFALGWTEAGGQVLSIEVHVFRRLVGSIGDKLWSDPLISVTGNVGSVMHESIVVAVRSALDLASGKLRSPPIASVNVHVSDVVSRKDGPSASLATAVAVFSEISGRIETRPCAYTGEVTLHGRILPIGGLREKIVAGRLAGISRFVLPTGNRTDWEAIEEEYREGVEVVFAGDLEDVLLGSAERLADQPLTYSIVE